jgi:hypothetical protein
MREPIEDKAGRVFRGKDDRQYGTAAAIGAQARSSTERAFAILPQDLESLIGAEP